VPVGRPFQPVGPTAAAVVRLQLRPNLAAVARLLPVHPKTAVVQPVASADPTLAAAVQQLVVTSQEQHHLG